MTPIDQATMAEIDPGELAADGHLVTEPQEARQEPLVAVQRPDRRHPVELTTTRLHDHVEAYGRHLTPAEIDTLAEAVEVLDGLRMRLDGLERRRARAGE